MFGVGVGWNRKEIANHGVDPAQRAAAGVDEVMLRLPTDRREIVLEPVGRLSALVAGLR